MTSLRVKPREGLKIRDPFTMFHIPPEGAEVITDGHFGTLITKHLRAGDLIEVRDEPAVEVAEAAAPEPKEELVSTAVAEAEPAPEPAAAPKKKNALREVMTDQRKAEGVTAPTESSKKEEG